MIIPTKSLLKRRLQLEQEIAKIDLVLDVLKQVNGEGPWEKKSKSTKGKKNPNNARHFTDAQRERQRQIMKERWSRVKNATPVVENHG